MFAGNGPGELGPQNNDLSRHKRQEEVRTPCLVHRGVNRPEGGGCLRSHSSLEVCWDKVQSYMGPDLVPAHVISEEEDG